MLFRVRARALVAVAASLALCAGITPHVRAATPVAEEPTVVLGGGLLRGAYDPDVSGPGDAYIAAVVREKSKTMNLYVTTGVLCTGSESTIRTTYSAQGIKLKAGAMTATLPTEATTYKGSLNVIVTLAADRSSGTVTVTGGTLVRVGGAKLSCVASKGKLPLRLASATATAPATGKALAGKSYVGAAAGDNQRTPFLMNVSASGRDVINRQVELFVDCAAKKPYEYLRLNDWARFPIDASGHFEFHETWSEQGAKLGIEATHKVEITTSTKGGFDGVRAAGMVRFDVKVLDASSGSVLDTCTSGDQPFEVHAV